LARTARGRRRPADAPGLDFATPRGTAGPGTAPERVAAYPRRERDVLTGCPIGRLTQDPDVMADESLRRPVTETFAWLRGRLTDVLAEGRDRG
jgi:hypothetical protein